MNFSVTALKADVLNYYRWNKISLTGFVPPRFSSLQRDFNTAVCLNIEFCLTCCWLAYYVSESSMYMLHECSVCICLCVSVHELCFLLEPSSMCLNDLIVCLQNRYPYFWEVGCVFFFFIFIYLFIFCLSGRVCSMASLPRCLPSTTGRTCQ